MGDDGITHSAVRVAFNDLVAPDALGNISSLLRAISDRGVPFVLFTIIFDRHQLVTITAPQIDHGIHTDPNSDLKIYSRIRQIAVVHKV